MKVLIVNYYSAPMTGAHAYRWSQIAEHWTKQGWQVDYICSKQKSDEVSVKNNYTTIGVGFPISAGVSVTSNKKATNSKPVKEKLVNLIKKVYQAVFWPDGLWHWFPFSFWAIRQNRRKQYDAIMSYSPTFSAHLAVLLFKRIYKQKFVWIADYGDPFSLSDSMPPNNFKIYGSLNNFIERKVIESCDSLVFTNNSTKQTYEQRYSCENKSQLIPHLVNLKEFYSDDIVRFQENSLNLVYVGGLHKGIREPYLAIDIISDLVELLRDKGIELIVDFYGPVNGIDISSLEGAIITWHGSIQRSDAIKVMKCADILLNIENINCVMTPSKIVEYIATGRPILNIVEQNKTELLGAYEESEYCYSVTCLDDKEGLVKFMSAMGGSVAKYESVSKFLDKHDLSNIAQSYGKLILLSKTFFIEGGAHF